MVRNFLLLFILSVSFTPSLRAQACDFKSDVISLGGASHDPGFGRNDNNDAIATLSNGNFVIGWSTDDGIDGDQAGAYFQVFSENGTPITSVAVPYAGINPDGTGDQGIFGPKVVALNSGFVIAWTSEDGPGDTGPVDDEQQDVFIRTYDNAGVAVSDPIRISVTGEEDLLRSVLALDNGNFVIITGTDEDNTGNKDDYYFQVFNAAGTSLSGGLVNISGNAHDAAYQTVNAEQTIIDLGGGNFAITWDTWDDVDGDNKGSFLRIFKSDGTAVTGIIVPYADINPGGTGDQGVPEPRLLKLKNGNFVVAWVSEQGPGDVGPGGDFNDDQDVYFRIYRADGTPVTGSLKANSDNAADEESLDGLIALEGGNFSVIYRNDEDQAGNTDDYFVRTFSPTGVALGASIELSAGAHLNSFVRTSGNRSYAALSNGNFVLGWSPDRSADGDSTSVYFRVFDASGNALTSIAAPYADINPGGTGPQSTNGPLIEALPNGFAIVWESADGPTDVGPGNNRDYDTYHRVYDNAGMALCGTKKTNSGSDGEEERPVFVQGLSNGDFVVMYRDEETNGNKDDFFARVIGGAPAAVCPTMGELTVTPACFGEPYTITVTGLENMAQADNGERDYGITFHAVLSLGDGSIYDDPDFAVIGTVPFSALTNGGTTATFSPTVVDNSNTLIVARLDAVPAAADCRPQVSLQREVFTAPFVSFTAPADLSLSAGLQSGLGGGTPAQGTAEGDKGVYSGPGVTDDGNGMTYSFDPTAAGVGMHTLTYTYTTVNGCEGMASDLVEVTMPVVVCPTIGEISFSSTCGGQPFSITVSGLENMAQADNGEQDYGISFYALLSGVPEDRYSDPGFGRIGMVPFSELGDGGSSATLSITDPNFIAYVDANPLIIAILDATPTDAECRPFATNTRQVNFKPFVSLPAPGNFCSDAGQQTGLGNVAPTGGTFSGPGITDDGNGSTYSLDPATAGTGTHELTYTFTTGESCTFTEVLTFEVFALPTVAFTAPADLDEDAGVQTGLGGGTPAQGTAAGDMGVYSGPGVTDDGNGMTYSFDPAAAGVGVHTITYMYTDANGCAASSSDDIEVTMQVPPGNSCIDANDITALFGQAVDVPQRSSIWDNTTYTVDPSDPETGTDCFFDARENPIWFTFTGDGNRYRISTTTDSLETPIPAGDTQMAIYTGACGSLTPLACSEDEDEGAGLFNASLEIDTEAGVVYSVLIDGVTSSLGNGRGAFQVEVTQLMVVNVTNIEETPITLFPNPTTGILHWQNINPERVQVFDYTGKLILSDQQPTTELNISALPAGFYLIRIEEGSEVYSAKVVKE